MRFNLLFNFHSLKGLDIALNFVLGSGGGEEGETNQQKLLRFVFEALFHALFKILGLGGNDFFLFVF